jgi:hypothetical protein
MTEYNRPIINRNYFERTVHSAYGNLRVYGIIPLKPKPVSIIFRNSVRISKRTPHFTITKINWLIMFKEMIVIYSKNFSEPINTGLLIVKAGGTYN